MENKKWLFFLQSDLEGAVIKERYHRGGGVMFLLDVSQEEFRAAPKGAARDRAGAGGKWTQLLVGVFLDVGNYLSAAKCGMRAGNLNGFYDSL